VVGQEVEEARSYRLFLVGRKHCGGQPANPRFRRAAVGLAAPKARLTSSAPAVWLRFKAVRSGVESTVATTSTTCVRVR
jgi:hypothetical protein